MTCCVKMTLSVLFVLLVATHAVALYLPREVDEKQKIGQENHAPLSVPRELEEEQNIGEDNFVFLQPKNPNDPSIPGAAASPRDAPGGRGGPLMPERIFETAAVQGDAPGVPSFPEVASVSGQENPGAHARYADSNERFCMVIDDDGKQASVKVYRYTLCNTPLGFTHLILFTEQKNNFSLLADHLPFHDEEHHSGNDVTHDNHLEVMAKHMRSMFKFAWMAIPESGHKFVNVSFLASCGAWTANAQSLQATLEEIRGLLADKDINLFNYKGPASVVVMSGEEQAAWSWVALNYMNGFFDKIENPNHSLGVMGLNHHSAFISFFTEGAILEGEHTITLARRKYRIYAKSHVGFGSWDILRKVVEENLVTPIHRNPCLLQGDLWRLSAAGKDSHVLVNGTGNPDACIQLLRNVIDVRGCQLDTCSIHNIYQPMLPEGMRFHAVQDFAQTPLNAHSYHDNQHYMNTINVLVQGINFCHEQNVFHASPLSNHRCLLSLYAPLLMSAFGYPEGSNTVIATSKLNGQVIDPALGLTVAHAHDSINHVSNAQNPVSYIDVPREDDGLQSILEDFGDNEEIVGDNEDILEDNEDILEDFDRATGGELRIPAGVENEEILEDNQDVLAGYRDAGPNGLDNPFELKSEPEIKEEEFSDEIEEDWDSDESSESYESIEDDFTTDGAFTTPVTTVAFDDEQ